MIQAIGFYLAGYAIAMAIVYLSTRRQPYYDKPNSITVWEHDRGDFIWACLLSWISVVVFALVALIELTEKLNKED